MRSTKRMTAAVCGAVAALALSACASLGATTTAAQQPTPGPSGSAATGGEIGSGCSALPADPSNPGSLEAMAQVKLGDALAGNPMVSTLATVVSADPELVDALNSAENITVFAPINDAFTKVPQADLDSLMADPATLKSVLTYHVVPEALTPQNLAGTHATLQGSDLTVTGSGEDFTVNETAKVVCGNVKTQNATVYFIDGVLMPS